MPLLLILALTVKAEYFTISIDSPDIPTSDDWIDVYDFQDERPFSENLLDREALNERSMESVEDDTLFKRPIYWFEVDENGNLRIP